MLQIGFETIPDYFKRWPKQADGELNEVTVYLGFTTLITDLREITPDNIDEWVYRTGAYDAHYGQPSFGGETRAVTREEIEGHIGLTTNADYSSREQFDKRMDELRYRKEHGRDRRGYVHVRKDSARPGRPCDIYSEYLTKDGTEQRRVEVYPDGRHLWVEDNYSGTGETDKEDTDFPGLAILNDRSGQSADTVEGELFERLWGQAVENRCAWVNPANTYLDDAKPEPCVRDAQEGSGFCDIHDEPARMMFPRMFVE